MAEYTPELGQALFSSPRQTYEVSDLLGAAVDRIAREWERCIGNRIRHLVRIVDSPFNTSGITFSIEELKIVGYSWDDSTEQPWNLKCGDVEISWYKHYRRGLSVNKEMTNDDIANFLDTALSIVRSCDTASSSPNVERNKSFNYNGTLYEVNAS